MTTMELVRTLWCGDFADWRAACVRARDEGWTLSQVQRVLFWAHPSTAVYAAILLFVGGAACFG